MDAEIANSAGLPRIDPYTGHQIVAAALVVAVPTALAFTLGLVLADLAAAILWAIIVGLIAGSVIVTSMLVAHVGVVPAVLGISGIWGLTFAALLAVLPSCPTWVGDTCGPRQYATAISAGMILPWLVLVFLLPIPLAIRAIWRAVSRRKTSTGS